VRQRRQQGQAVALRQAVVDQQGVEARLLMAVAAVAAGQGERLVGLGHAAGVPVRLRAQQLHQGLAHQRVIVHHQQLHGAVGGEGLHRAMVRRPAQASGRPIGRVWPLTPGQVAAKRVTPQPALHGGPAIGPVHGRPLPTEIGHSAPRAGVRRPRPFTRHRSMPMRVSRSFTASRTAAALVWLGLLTACGGDAEPGAAAPAPAPPVLTAQPQDAEAGEGERARFSVTATSNAGALSVQWWRGSGSGAEAVPGAVQPTYDTPPLALQDDGLVLSARVANAVGSTATREATLRVRERSWAASPLPACSMPIPG